MGAIGGRRQKTFSPPGYAELQGWLFAVRVRFRQAREATLRCCLGDQLELRLIAEARRAVADGDLDEANAALVRLRDYQEREDRDHETAHDAALHGERYTGRVTQATEAVVNGEARR